MIDLHTHSNNSDGTLSPTELAYAASKIGLSAIALTDHDTISGIHEFRTACAEYGIDGIGGVEISAKYKTEMHILGLFIDENNTALKNSLIHLKNSRAERNSKMLALLNEYGFDMTERDIIGQKDDGRLENTGRAHMAFSMVRKGYVASAQEAFDKYLSKGCPCYVPRLAFSPEESIEIITNAGGLAVLAHPKYITCDADELRKLLIELKSYGLAGVECYYSQHTKEFMHLCLSLCRELDLLPTGGSDYHADNKPDIQLGSVCGDMTVPDELLTNLKNMIK